ncbi:hypothetical protein MHN79_02320 [Vibrio sp. Of14-4]|uniref:RCC1 domain-containing protein n=1 Tax=Vibrio sp. Of14-4 TaxID=2724878 RepID=UPI001EF226B8|nr:hypothetical protein [Vibrio sp. Of14-4]MCG7488314.1 hypothetical protein [Vibrio sp. Of14-4]
MKVGLILISIVLIASAQAQEPRTWQSMDLGSSHSCAISTYGQLHCWGNNYSGELGLAISNAHTFNTPQSVNIRYPIDSVHLGGAHTCAILQSGSVKCWGSNSRHLLRNHLHRLIAPTNLNLEDIPSAISINEEHACYTLANNTAKCWGENFFGQLGTGSTNPRLHPASVFNQEGVLQVETGSNFSCLVNNLGQVKCWGNNYFGQLGIGFPPWHLQDTNSYLIPQLVETQNRVLKVSSGKVFSCALNENGRVLCWGNNQYGQIGIGSNLNSPLPQTVTLPLAAIDIEVGDHHACAILSDSSLSCWGNNQYGQLGIGDTINRSTPVGVSLGSDTHSISLGAYHSCALLTNGVMKCWGDNVHGQLGIGNNMSTTLPQTVY